MRIEHARAILAAKKTFVARILCLPERSASNDLTSAELAMLTGEGLAVVAYQFFRRGGHTAETGKSDGEAMVKAADAIGYPRDAVVFVDLECDMTPSRLQAEAYARAWRDAVVAAARIPGAYLDKTFMRSGCDIAGLFPYLWQAGSRPPPPAGQTYDITQGSDLNVAFAGLPFDLDEASGPLPWCVSDAAQPVPGPLPMPAPAPTPPGLFVFAFRPGESVGDRHARCWEEMLAAGPMGHTVRGAWYASCVNVTKPAGYVGGQPVDSIASWSTSCAVTQHASQAHAGKPTKPAVNGSGIYDYIGATEQHPAWQSNDGKATPSRGDILYWANSGTDGHVECLRRIRDDGTWETAGGGGGSDGTGCSLREHKRGIDAYGRRLRGWWRIAMMGLPASEPLPEPAPVAPPAPPEPVHPPPEPMPPPVPQPVAPVQPATGPNYGAIIAGIVVALGAAVAALSQCAAP